MFEVNFVTALALKLANLISFEIVVVHGYHNGIDTARQKFYAHAIAERRFSARRRTRNADKADIFDISVDFFAKLGKHAIVFCLAHLHEIEFVAVLDSLVYLGNSLRFGLFSPQIRSLKRASVHTLFHKFGYLRTQFVSRILDNDAGAVRSHLV